MKGLRIQLIIAVIFILLSCSDGTQTVTKINEIVNSDDYDIQNVVIEIVREGGQTEVLNFPKDSLVIENQYIRSNGLYVNIGSVKTFRIANKTLEIKL